MPGKGEKKLPGNLPSLERIARNWDREIRRRKKALWESKSGSWTKKGCALSSQITEKTPTQKRKLPLEAKSELG